MAEIFKVKVFADVKPMVMMLGKTDSILKRNILNALNAMGLKVIRRAKKKYLSAPLGPSPFLHAPSGRLRASITFRTFMRGDKFILEPGTNVNYARKHEEGIGVRKRPFIQPAIDDNANFFKERMGLALQLAADGKLG